VTTQTIEPQTIEVLDEPDAGVEPQAPAPVTPTLCVHLLGDLGVTMGDRSVDCWTSGRGRVIFEYLVAHRRSAVPLERLLGIFWPDATPERARNCLHVAMHGLRRSLRAVAADVPVIVCRNQAYMLEPALTVWLDVDAFETHLKSATRFANAGDVLAARDEYEAAIDLYQGDFLASDPYEGWATSTREHLRAAYMDALAHLALLRFDVGDYAGCAAACIELLARDTCREDAHCLLMRCYERRGQPQLAVRQYHQCVAALRNELRMEPATGTTDLFHQIRRREPISAGA
jgi:DNA-binding SARP family transcriptional activator